MKKISLFIVAILLIIPFTVSAAEYKVEKLNASNTSGTIKYDGTMETGSTAVKCWLYEGTTELNYYSSAVDNTKFNGTFTVSKNGEYIVKCANYEGGDLKETTVKVDDLKEDEPTSVENKEETKTEEKKTSKTSKNPKTGDNVLTFVSLMMISLLGIGLVTFKLKENK